MNRKISVIIPVYNAEKNIGKTIESILEQTNQNFEIICINDGSKDQSLKVIKEYEKNNRNIIVIDKKNEGVWKARMDGIQKATGEYITFIDADDRYKKDFLASLYNNITREQSDIAVCGFQRIDEKTKEIISEEMKHAEERIIDMERNPEEVISINTALWNKMYKASLLKDIKEIENPPRILEDMMLLALAYLKVKKISFVNQSLYEYMVMQGSAMNTSKKGETDALQKAMLEVKEQYQEQKASKERMEILASMAFLHFGVSTMFYIAKNKNIHFKEEYQKNLKFLNHNFPEWKKTKYLSLFYCMTQNKYNLKVAIMKKTYTLHCFRMFIYIYQTLKLGIKW